MNHPSDLPLQLDHHLFQQPYSALGTARMRSGGSSPGDHVIEGGGMSTSSSSRDASPGNSPVPWYPSTFGIPTNSVACNIPQPSNMPGVRAASTLTTPQPQTQAHPSQVGRQEYFPQHLQETVLSRSERETQQSALRSIISNQQREIFKLRQQVSALINTNQQHQCVIAKDKEEIQRLRTALDSNRKRTSNLFKVLEAVTPLQGIEYMMRECILAEELSDVWCKGAGPHMSSSEIAQLEFVSSSGSHIPTSKVPEERKGEVAVAGSSRDNLEQQPQGTDTGGGAIAQYAKYVPGGWNIPRLLPEGVSRHHLFRSLEVEENERREDLYDEERVELEETKELGMILGVAQTHMLMPLPTPRQQEEEGKEVAEGGDNEEGVDEVESTTTESSDEGSLPCYSFASGKRLYRRADLVAELLWSPRRDMVEMMPADAQGRTMPLPPDGTLHQELMTVVDFCKYPTRAFPLTPQSESPPKEEMVRMFIGQLPYNVTDMQIGWMAYAFGGGVKLHHSDRITKLDRTKRQLLPTGCFHFYVEPQYVDSLMVGVHKKLLVDDTGIWVAKDEKQDRILKTYSEQMKNDRTKRFEGHPYGTVVIQHSTSCWSDAGQQATKSENWRF